VKLKESIEDNQIDRLDEASLETLCDIVDGEFQQLQDDRHELRAKIMKKPEEKIHLPIDMERLLWTSRERFNIRQRI
jgi:hypothetical protein